MKDTTLSELDALKDRLRKDGFDVDVVTIERVQSRLFTQQRLLESFARTIDELRARDAA